MTSLFIKVLKILVGQWIFFYIYKKSIHAIASSLSNLSNVNIEKKSDEEYELSLIVDDLKVCTLTIVWGNVYKKRNFIKLKSNEAKIISVETLSAYRGCGYAKELLKATEIFASSKNITVLYARIWHSNESSIKAFEKSGWHKAYRKINLKLLNVIPLNLKL